MTKRRDNQHMEEEPISNRVFYTTNHPSDDYPVEKSFNKLWGRIQEFSGKETKKGRFTRWKIFYAAASVAVILVFGYFIFVNQQEPKVFRISTNSERHQHHLPDGSTVWLNTNSELTYSGNFGKKNRNVELSGEAYFDVVKNSRLTFSVNTGDVKIQVLGTEFNVRAYPENNAIVTTLIRGSVNIENSSSAENIKLIPGQQLIFDKLDGYMAVNEVDHTLFTAWKDGKLLFKQTSVDKAFLSMEQNFRVKIITKNDLLFERKISGRFDLDDTPEKILDIMQETIPFHYKKTNDTIYIE